MTDKPSRKVVKMRRGYTYKIPYKVAVLGCVGIWWLSYMPDPVIYIVCRVFGLGLAFMRVVMW